MWGDTGFDDVDVQDIRAERICGDPVIDGPVRVPEGAGPWSDDGGSEFVEESGGGEFAWNEHFKTRRSCKPNGIKMHQTKPADTLQTVERPR